MDYQNPLARDLFVAQVKFLETQLEKTQNFLTINQGSRLGCDLQRMSRPGCDILTAKDVTYF